MLADYLRLIIRNNNWTLRYNSCFTNLLCAYTSLLPVQILLNGCSPSNLVVHTDKDCRRPRGRWQRSLAMYKIALSSNVKPVLFVQKALCTRNTTATVTHVAAGPRLRERLFVYLYCMYIMYEVDPTRTVDLNPTNSHSFRVWGRPFV